MKELLLGKTKMSSIIDFKDSSIQDVIQFILQATEEKIIPCIPRMNQEQINAIIQYLNTLPPGENRDKIKIIIENI